MQHLVDEGIIACYHPRVAPDEISSGNSGPERLKEIEPFKDMLRELVRGVAFGEDVAKGGDHIQRIVQGMNVAHPHWIILCQGLHLFLFVLFFIGDDQVRPEGSDHFGLHLLGAAHAGFGAEPFFGMDAEFGDAGHIGPQVVQ